jgi:hypothetical protein
MARMKMTMILLTIVLLATGLHETVYCQPNNAEISRTVKLNPATKQQGGITTEEGLRIKHNNGYFSRLSSSFGFELSILNFAAMPISFATSPTYNTALTRLFIDTRGNIGIGSIDPDTKLDIKGETDKTVLVKLNQRGTKNWSGWRLDRDSVEKWFVGMDTLSNKLHFRRSASSNDMTIDETGNVGIGVTNPGYKLEVNGAAAKPSGGAWTNSSDIRLKDIDGEYEKGLDAIMQLHPVKFRYKMDNPRNLPSDSNEIGFIAQEVRDTFPEAVSEGNDGYLDFNMHPVNMAVINAIKELKAENDSLKQEIQKLKAALGQNS